MKCSNWTAPVPTPWSGTILRVFSPTSSCPPGPVRRVLLPPSTWAFSTLRMLDTVTPGPTSVSIVGIWITSTAVQRRRWMLQSQEMVRFSNTFGLHKFMKLRRCSPWCKQNISIWPLVDPGGGAMYVNYHTFLKCLPFLPWICTCLYLYNLHVYVHVHVNVCFEAFWVCDKNDIGAGAYQCFLVIHRS